MISVLNRLLIGFLCLIVQTSITGGELSASEVGTSTDPDPADLQFIPLQDDRINGKSYQSSVYAIFQDSEGFLWIGTHIGLLVYDGYHIKQYFPVARDQTTISDFNILSIAEDNAGDIWTGSMDGGISRLDRATERFTRYKNDPGNPDSVSSDDVWKVYMTPSGEMWIGTWGGGLNRYDFDSGKFIRYQANPDEPSSLSSDIINAIFEDHSGALWIGTNHGLDRFDRETERFFHFRHDPHDPRTISDNNVTVIVEDANHTLWIGTGNGGLNQFDPEREYFSHFQHLPDAAGSPSSNKISAILENDDGSLWIGTIGSGLDRFEHRTGMFSHYHHEPSDPRSLSTDSIRTLFRDRSGLIWVGLQDGGIAKVRRNKQGFHYHPLPKESGSIPPGEIVTAISERDENSLWIGTLYGGLIRYHPKSHRHRRYRHDPEDPGSLGGNMVTAILKDREGNLWVGTYTGGLNQFDPEERRFHRYRHDPENPDSIGADAISALVEDPSGDLWIGTRNKGLNRYDKHSGRFIRYRHDANNPESVSSDAVTALCLDASGHLWIGTKKDGLNRFDPETGTSKQYSHNVNNSHTLSSDKILTLHQDRRGVLWIGTNGGGLNKFDFSTGRFADYRQEDGLANDTIRAILEDDYGILWLKSWGGDIIKFNPETEVFTNFGEESGLRPEQSLIGGAYRNDKGRIYFGGPQGYYTFHPYYNTHIPDIQITDFKLFNESVTPRDDRQILRSSITRTQTIQLTYRDQVFSFEFAALDFTAPNLNQYAYMLEGIDDDWIYAGTQRTALYANIPPGNYTFRVKGSNNDGIWNEAGRSIDILMAPPPWRTWWAYSLYILAVIGLFIGYGRFRAHRHAIAVKRQQETAYRIQLEKEVAQRTSELVETNHQLTAEISERKRIEESLRLSEEKYRNIIETAHEGYILIDENFSIVDVNDEFCKMIDWNRNELIDKPLDALGVDEFRHFLRMNRRNLFKEGGFEVKGKLARKNGRPIPVLLHGSVLRHNTGRPIGNVIFVTDLSVGEMSLALAAEVQNSLLNSNELSIEGLDLFGRSRPCEDVGGDYFDLIQTPDTAGRSLIAVVGDISGHGVEAALLMTTARSYLRMRAQQEGSLSNIVSDLNRHIFADVNQTYRFMTFFILALDDSKNDLEWVRAGHDPALLYDPTTDAFIELGGTGIALGLDEDYPYPSFQKERFETDQIIVLSSDGISETRDIHGEMFGKERLCDVVRSSSQLPAKKITEKVFDAVGAFTKGTLPDDDRTLVVIKRTRHGTVGLNKIGSA